MDPHNFKTTLLRETHNYIENFIPYLVQNIILILFICTFI